MTTLEGGPVARVLMMVGNDISHDTRVLKSALALADGGVEVTVLGYASTGVRTQTWLGPVRMIRVPIAWHRRDAHAAARAARRATPPSLAPSSAQRRALDLQARLRAQEAATFGGPLRRARAVATRGVRETARVRAGLDRRIGPLFTRAWRAGDGALSRLATGASWRVLLPEIDDYEVAFGPVIDSLDWDVLHAHDVHMVGVASAAVARRRASGRSAAWVYDAHEYVAGLSLYGGRTARKRAAYLDLEREFVRDADLVVTVTEPLAFELQRRYRLPLPPVVVMNSPVLGAGAKPVETGIRQACALADDIPLMTYSGGVTAARGVVTAVEALPLLPGVHLAVVCVPHTEIHGARELTRVATTLGVADRLHLLEPVRPDEVSAFLASADVGLLPLNHFGSHEVALANKLFEYLYGGIPVVVSDCKAQADFVRRHEVGAVHVAGDAASLAEAVRSVLAEAAPLRRRIAAAPELLEPFAWEHQERALRGAYRELLGATAVSDPERSSTLDGLTERAATRADRAPVVAIGPANMAGQAWAWAKALEREVAGLRTEVIVVDRGSPLVFRADEIVPAVTYAKDLAWGAALESRALAEWTHVLLEAGRPLLGLRYGKDFTGEVPVYRGVGIKVGLLVHGSEVRNPSRHAMTTPWSPFRDAADPLTVRLQEGHDRLAPLVRAFDGPIFASTPDLLDDVPEATWLPVVVDVAEWATSAPVLEKKVPVVVHAPSRQSLKGTVAVENAIAPLVAEGLVDYRLVEGVAPAEMPSVIAGADIVLDQFALGSYGVLAVQAMAARRVVVGHVTETVRGRCPGVLPIVEATPDTLTAVLRHLVGSGREEGAAAATAGAAYAAQVHDGRLAAGILADGLGLRRS